MYPQQSGPTSTVVAGIRVVVGSTKFEAFSAIVIGVNALAVGAQTQRSLEKALAGESVRKMGAVDDVLTAVGYAMFLWYVLEVTLKMFAWRRAFFLSSEGLWNCFDLFLVTAASYEILNELVVGGGATPWTVVLRLIKLVKLLRMVRVVRFFPELRTMLFCMMGSARTLFWTLLMLGLILYIFGLCFLQGITAELASGNSNADFQTAVHGHWASVPGAMITLFEAITGGNDWSLLAQPIRDINGFYYSIFLFYILFLVFAVLNILTGIFVDSALAVGRETDKQHRQKEHDLEKKWFAIMAARLVDAEGPHHVEGYITWAEFQSHLEDAAVQDCLAELGVETYEAERFFRLLASSGSSRRSAVLGSGQACATGDRLSADDRVAVAEFIEGCTRLQGQARSMDQARLYYMCKETSLATRNIDAKLNDLRVLVASVLPAYARSTTAVPANKSQELCYQEGSVADMAPGADLAKLSADALLTPVPPCSFISKTGTAQDDAVVMRGPWTDALSELEATLDRCDDAELLRAVSARAAQRMAVPHVSTSRAAFGELPPTPQGISAELVPMGPEEADKSIEKISAEVSLMRDEFLHLKSVILFQVGGVHTALCSAGSPCQTRADQHEDKHIDVTLGQSLPQASGIPRFFCSAAAPCPSPVDRHDGEGPDLGVGVSRLQLASDRNQSGVMRWSQAAAPSNRHLAQMEVRQRDFALPR